MAGRSNGTPNVPSSIRTVRASTEGEIASSTTAFVGRGGELEKLLGAANEALSGRGRVILLGGEPGIGKSTLTDEFARQARIRGFRVLSGRCWEFGGAPAYWPWVQALRSYLRDVQPTQWRAEMGGRGSDLVQLFPELRDLFPDPGPPANVDPETARFRVFEATAGFLRAAAGARPLLLVLDDLHAADVPSLMLLAFLAGELTDAPVLVVGVYRDAETQDQERAAALADVASSPGARTLRLGGLTKGQVAELIEAVAKVEVPDALVDAIHQETEGNPLFVGELVRLLDTEGRLRGASETRSGDLRVPRGLREVIDRRLGHLPPACIEALTIASVLGREFSIGMLGRMLGWEREELLAVLVDAVRAGVLADVPGSVEGLRFSHALIRDALYEEFPSPKRRPLHRQAGEILEDLHAGNLDPHLAELAHHFFLAIPAVAASKAMDYSRRAADRAMQLLAYEEAARLYRRALQVVELAEDSHEETRGELLLALGDAQMRAGDTSAAKGTFRAAAEVAISTGLPELLGRAALAYGGRFVWARAGEDEHVVSLLHEALDALGEVDTALRARLLARLAGALRDQPSREPRATIGEQAVEMARRIGDPATLAYALDGRYAAVWWPDNPQERLAIADEIVDLAQRVGDKERLAAGLDNRVCALLELGEMEAADADIALLNQLAEELRQPAQMWIALHMRAMRTLFDGRFDEAEEAIQRTLDMGRRAQGLEAFTCYANQMFFLRREQGRVEEMATVIVRTVREHPANRLFRCLEADVLRSQGRRSEATGMLQDILADGFTTVPSHNEWGAGMSYLSEVAAFVEDPGAAEDLYSMLLPYAGRALTETGELNMGSASRNLGILAATLHKWEEAASHFEDALEMNERMGSRPWVAHTRHDYARMLLQRDAGDDRERAQALLEQALGTARRLGMTALSAQISTLSQEEGLGEATRASERAGPSGAWAAQTFLFTDIVRSTELVEVVGDEAWEDLLRWHDRTLRSFFEEHGGAEVDHTGDGFFVAFHNPRSAIECAVRIQRALAEHRRVHGFAPTIRIGVHAGDARRVEGAYRGRAVHQCARIAAAAAGGEILASVETALQASHVPTSSPRKVELKGLSSPVEIVTITWAEPA